MSREITEKEAGEKWCPFARAYDVVFGDQQDHPVTVNRKARSEPDNWCFCIASRCMAWRWSTLVTGEHTRGHCGLVNEGN